MMRFKEGENVRINVTCGYFQYCLRGSGMCYLCF